MLFVDSDPCLHSSSRSVYIRVYVQFHNIFFMKCPQISLRLEISMITLRLENFGKVQLLGLQSKAM
jgi:hypothetical protein